MKYSKQIPKENLSTQLLALFLSMLHCKSDCETTYFFAAKSLTATLLSHFWLSRCTKSNDWNFIAFQHKPSYCLMFSLSFLLYFTGLKPVLFMLGHCLLVYMCCFIFKSITAVWICNLGILLSLQIDAAKIWQVRQAAMWTEQLRYAHKQTNKKDLVVWVSFLMLVSQGT